MVLEPTGGRVGHVSGQCTWHMGQSLARKLGKGSTGDTARLAGIFVFLKQK